MPSSLAATRLAHPCTLARAVFASNALDFERHGQASASEVFQFIDAGWLFSDGSAVVADWYSGVVVLSPDGTTHETLAMVGEGPGEVISPYAVLVPEVRGQTNASPAHAEVARSTRADCHPGIHNADFSPCCSLAHLMSWTSPERNEPYELHDSPLEAPEDATLRRSASCQLSPSRDGWYRLLRSKSLRRGQVRYLECLGCALVVWRSEDADDVFCDVGVLPSSGREPRGRPRLQGPHRVSLSRVAVHGRRTGRQCAL